MLYVSISYIVQCNKYLSKGALGLFMGVQYSYEYVILNTTVLVLLLIDTYSTVCTY